MQQMSALTPDQAETDAAVIARLMRSRFSCRAFLPDPIPDETIAAIMDCARWSPSWCNMQPWGVVVTRPPTTAALSAALLAAAEQGTDAGFDLPPPQAEAPIHQERRREVGMALYDALSIRRDDRAARHAHELENYRFFGAPHVVLLSIPASFGAYGTLDLGNFLGGVLLAAAAHGVASLPQAALAQHAAVVRRVCALPDDHAFVCGIALGRADMAHPANNFRAPRVAGSEVFRFA